MSHSAKWCYFYLILPIKELTSTVLGVSSSDFLESWSEVSNLDSVTAGILLTLNLSCSQDIKGAPRLIFFVTNSMLLFGEAA
ncbi:hypothetical protein WR25_16860 [Diploscapter pachys]|uniref:Uncharacterized protein n=1 Tax=Diploscapter pachys TaxID=2018661 RepID=A0A2A2LDY7_9BILA|nr:hypothetical protein WR25_16860 [Diploscapter pachys]